MHIQFINGRNIATLEGQPSARDIVEINAKQTSDLICNRSLGWLGNSYVFLRDIPTLRALTVLDGMNVDLSPIASLHQLEKLTLHTPKRSKFDFSALTNLRHCSVDWCLGAESVFKLRRIESLSVMGMPRQYCGRIQEFPDLSELKLFSVKLEQIEELGSLTSLKKLRLANCRRLSSLKGIHEFQALQDLWLQSCSIVSIDDLQGLSSLKRLLLEDCGELVSISPLAGLSSIQELFINGTTKIKDGDLSPIKNLKNLKKLGVRKWPHYRRIDLQLNDE